jgi:sugar O-acyltransferase (sialic acid O-acetyltransferase NeuD family)
VAEARTVLILGAGGHGQVVADLLLAAGGPLHPLGFLDDDPALMGAQHLGLTVLGPIRAAATIAHAALIPGIGDNEVRRRIYQALVGQGEQFVTVCHPRAVVAANVALGAGTVICAGAVVNTGSRVGINCILNPGCTVDHHNQIGDHAHIAPGAHLGGGVTVGPGTLVGIGALVLPGRRIGAGCIVGAGAVVTHDLADGVVVTGIPARSTPARSRTHS